MQEETDGDGEKDGKETVSKVPLKVNLNNGTNGHVEDRKKNYIMNQGKGKKEDGEISKECLYPCLSRYRSRDDFFPPNFFSGRSVFLGDRWEDPDDEG